MAEPHSKEKKEEEIEERTAPAGEVVYRAIHSEGEHELKRDSRSLAWSGLAAGLSMGFSMICEALLRTHLPEADWAPLVSKFGYSVGFLIVILGRQQLFTKNTLTVILPLLRERRAAIFRNVARLWAIVLLTNLVGVFLAAWLLGSTSIIDPEVHATLATLGREAMGHSFGGTLLRAILAGWFIALMVWLLPFAETGRVAVIIILAYFIGLAHLPHIVAGSGKVFFLVVTGGVSFWDAIGAFVIPTLIGNVLGGVSLVAALAHAEFVAGESGENLK